MENPSMRQRQSRRDKPASLCFVKDITEKKQAEVKVQEEDAKLSAMISSMEEGVIFVDDDNVIIEVNDYFCKFVGKERDALLGQKIEAFHSGNRLGKILSHISYFRKQTSADPLIIQRSFGESEIIFHIQPVCRNQCHNGVLLNAIEVTDLVRARRKAEATSLAKSEFLANMSHEIRTPLNGITGVLDLLLISDLTPKQQELVEMLKISTNSLIAQLNDVLDYSKIEANQLILEHIDFDLREILEPAVYILAVKARQKGLKMALHMKPDVPNALTGDPGRLRQVIVNLVSNAIKFSEEGEVIVGVETEKIDDSSATLHFAISDTGIGIPPDQLENIFDRFAQGDSCVTRKYGGTGLGLSISSRLVELMNGRIWVESEPNKGSIFNFTVDFVLNRARAPAQKPAALTLHTLPAAREKLNVLLAEDNTINQKVAVEVLRARGHRVTVCANGKEALEAFDRSTFNLILMDIQMPEINGMEAARRIREREASQSSIQRIPIIAMTAHAMKKDRDACFAAGMDGYISKPINAGDFIQVVEKAASRAPVDKEKTALIMKGHKVEDPTPETIFDLDQTLENLGGSRELFLEIADMFFENVPDCVPRIREGINESDSDALERAAHALKGQVGHFGAKRCFDAAHRLERMGARGDMLEAEDAFLKLETEVKLLGNEIKKAVKEVTVEASCC